MSQFANKLFRTLLGMELVEDIGIVDITTLGCRQNITQLSIVRNKEKYFMDIHKIFKWGWLPGQNYEIYCPLDSQNHQKITHKFSMILDRMQNPGIDTSNASLWDTIFYCAPFLLLGYRRICDLGRINLFSIVGNQIGMIIQKDDIRFLYVSVTNSTKPCFLYFSEGAVKAILAQLKKIPDEFIIKQISNVKGE